jgi:hypothetical protein
MSKQAQYEMFGTETAVLDLVFSNRHPFLSAKDVLMSILSDAQEELHLSNGEQSRRLINQVKYLLEQCDVKVGLTS